MLLEIAKSIADCLGNGYTAVMSRNKMICIIKHPPYEIDVWLEGDYELVVRVLVFSEALDDDIPFNLNDPGMLTAIKDYVTTQMNRVSAMPDLKPKRDRRE